MKKENIKTLFTILLVCSILGAIGQPPPPPPPPNGGAPIDGGALALLIGAAVYGYRKFKNQE